VDAAQEEDVGNLYVNVGVGGLVGWLVVRKRVERVEGLCVRACVCTYRQGAYIEQDRAQEGKESHGSCCLWCCYCYLWVLFIGGV
jgi:hypothetical protein